MNEHVLDDLEAYALGALDQTDAQRIAAHLATCGTCRTEAAALPWHAPEVLRCLVPPPLLAELALAAVVEGRAAALDVLDRVPGCRRWLRSSAYSPSP